MVLTPQEAQELADLQELEKLLARESKLVEQQNFQEPKSVEGSLARGMFGLGGKTNLGQDISREVLRGTVKGGADTLQLAQNTMNLATQPWRTKLPEQLTHKQILGQEEIPREITPPQGWQTFLGDEAERARQYAENIPKNEFTKSIPGLLTQAVPEAANFVGRVEALGGGIRGLAKVGALEGAPEGSGEALKRALINAGYGKVFEVISGIRPQGARPSSLLGPARKSTGTIKTALARMGLGGGLFAAPAAISGESPEEITAKAIEGAAFTAVPSKGPSVRDRISYIRRNIGRTEQRPGVLARAIKMEKSLAKESREQAKNELDRMIEQERNLLKEQQSQLGVEEQARLSTVNKRKKESLSALEQEGIAREGAIKKIEQRTKDERQARRSFVAQRIKEARKGSREQIKAEDARLEQDLKVIENRANEAVENLAPQLQQPTMELFKSKSREYRKRYDHTADAVDASNEPITRVEALEIISNSLSRSKNSAEIQSGPLYQRLRELEAKYKFTDQEGNPIEGKNPEDVIPFKEFNQDVRDTVNMIDFSSRASSKEIPGFILQDEAGNFLAKKSEDFAKLQQAYSPVIGAMSRLARSFATYRGQFETDVAESSIKSMAEGEAPGGLKRASKVLQEGTKEFPGGLGDVFGSVRKIVGEKAQAIERTSAAQKIIKGAAEKQIKDLENQISSVEREFNSQLDEIEVRRSQNEAQLQQQTAGVKKQSEQERFGVERDIAGRKEFAERSFSEKQRQLTQQTEQKLAQIENKLRNAMKSEMVQGKVTREGLQRRLDLAQRKLTKLRMVQRILNIMAVGAGGAIAARVALSPLKMAGNDGGGFGD